MKAYWLESGEPIPTEKLKAEGIDYEWISPDDYQAILDKKKAAHGYVEQDVVALTPKMENLDMILAKFDKEHLHTLDEVRYVLDGAGIFDIRSKDDRWMRVEVTRGDYISVPANRHHRFFCTEAKNIKCVRLFQDSSGWSPIYRPGEEKAAARG